MLSLDKIVSFAPLGRKTLADLTAENTITAQSASVFKTVFGLRQIAKTLDGDLAALLDASLIQIVPPSAADKAKIKYIFHCHAAANVCPPGVSLLGDLKKKYGLEHCISVGLCQEQCATPLTALHLIEALLDTEDDTAQALLLMGEVSYHYVLEAMPDTTILGEASAACLVGKVGARNKVLALAHRKFALSAPGAKDLSEPETTYGEELIQVVRDALVAASLTIDDVSIVLGHNVNVISWRFFARNYPFPMSSLHLANVAELGHCFTSDPFLNYTDATNKKALNEGDYYLMVSVGAVSSFVAVVLQH